MRFGLARALATVGGLGDRLPAPGTTVGSLAGVALFWAVTGLVLLPVVVVALVALAVLVPVSVWACGVEARRRGVSDPNAAALDEVVGQWLALTVLVMVKPQPPAALAYGMAFVLFRVFDILKPWPIRALEKLPGGWGIVADDLAAGAVAGGLAALLLHWL